MAVEEAVAAGCAEPSEDPASFPPGVRDAAGGEQAMDLLTRFAGLLAAEGEVRGLMGPRELPRLWSRHIINSLAINGFVPNGARVADIGSGAGFPGMVLAITRPDVSTTLIESMERRTEWLHEAVQQLGLVNVEVVTARAEALHGSVTFDAVTGRAVAPLGRFARWALPLVAPGGLMLALKGARAAEELAAAAPVLGRLGGNRGFVEEVSSPLDGELTRVVVVRRGTNRAARGR